MTGLTPMQTQNELSRSRAARSKASSWRDPLRVMVALVCILFASFSSREQDSLFSTQGPQILVHEPTQSDAADKQLADFQAIGATRTGESKRIHKIPETQILRHMQPISGSI